MLKDILRLQMHALNSKIMTVQTQITGTTPVFAIDEAKLKQGVVPGLDQIHVLQPHMEVDVDDLLESREASTNEQSDLANDQTKANVCSVDSQADSKQDMVSSLENIQTIQPRMEMEMKYLLEMLDASTNEKRDSVVDPNQANACSIDPQKPKSIPNQSIEQPSIDIVDKVVLEELLQRCSIELKSFIRTKTRILAETFIFESLNTIARSIDNNLVLHRIGSAFYGLAREKSDFNVMITTKKSTSFFSFGRKSLEPLAIFNVFKDRLNKSDSQFGAVTKMPMTRTHEEQLRMVHKASGIHCSIHIDSSALATSADIISKIIEKKPFGKIKCFSQSNHFWI